MDFSDKLSNLMLLTGITNSKLAKAMSIDPSLVSRWRNGARRPTQHSDVIVRLSAYLASHITTAHHRTLLAGLITDRSIMAKTGDDIFEAILHWLNDSKAFYTDQPPRQPQALAPPPQVLENSAFIGDGGRRLVSASMLRHFDRTAPAQTIRFYSNTPLQWIVEHTRHRDAALARVPDLFDHVDRIRLLMNSNATNEEIVRLLEYLLPLLHSGVIEIAQIPRYRKELFTNTITIAGSGVAAVSHGFAASASYTTNLYTDSAYIRQLAADFDALFAKSERVHTTAEGITLIDILEEYQPMLLGNASMTYLGNCLPSILVKPQLLARIAARAYSGVDKVLEGEGLLACCADTLDGFLSRNTFVLHLPLYGLRDVQAGAASISGIPHLAYDKPAITPEENLLLLKHLMALLDRYENLLLNPIHELPHDHGVLLQTGVQVFAIRQRQPLVWYNSKYASIVRALESLIGQRHGSEEAVRARQPEARAALAAHIAALEK